MNMHTAVEEKMDVIVKTLGELKEEKEILGDDRLIPLLAQTYDKILPPIAKMFVKPDQFVNACLERKTEILNKVNRNTRRNLFSVVG